MDDDFFTWVMTMLLGMFIGSAFLWGTAMIWKEGILKLW